MVSQLWKVIDMTIAPDTLKSQIVARMTTDAAHDWAHIERVYAHGMTIAQEEPEVNLTVLQAALLLHDIGTKVIGKGNAVVTEEDVATLLTPLGVDASLFGAIVTAINDHSFTRGARPRSVEAAIVQDADRLDAIGAIGIARCFAYGGAHDRPLYDPNDQSNSIQHFYDKLFTLKDKMNTAGGKRLAAERHAVMEAFVAQFMKEWEAR
jgi:uncharacterized protein